MKRVVFILCLLLMGYLPSLAQGGKSYDIIMPEGNSILSYIPVNELKNIDSLRIRGIMYSADFDIILRCTNLKYLDMSQAYLTGEDSEKAASVLSFKKEIEKMLEGRGGINAINHIEQVYTEEYGQSIIQSLNLKEASKDCHGFIGSFNEWPALETVILPVWAWRVNKNNFNKCPVLKNVVLPPFLTEISEDSFTRLPSLHRITFPKTLKTIGRWSFEKSHLWEIDLSQCEGWEGYLRSYDECFFSPDGDDLHKRIIKLPQGMERTLLELRPGDEIYLPSSFVSNTTSSYSSSWNGAIIHISSTSLAPGFNIAGRDLTVYVPKGRLTVFYAAFKEGTNIIEE